MTAEEPIGNNIPDISISDEQTVKYLLEVIIGAIEPFTRAIKQSNLILPLNENKLTQIFVEQIEVILKSNPFIGVKNQYSDLFFESRGIPDFYFHVVEEGALSVPIFIIESKRLPSPTYEKEYIIGQKENGGIERFKLEKHGKGIKNCGMLGFIETNDTSFWLKSINEWIEELSATNSIWEKEECLNEIEKTDKYSYLKSIAYTLKSGEMLLHHFWIEQN